MRPSRGFTLLEIMVALVIAALAITAVAKATGGAATVAGETEERMLAVWAAGNRLSEMRITRAWPAPGSYEATSTMGGRTWYLAQTVSDTDDEDIRRVDIDVFTDPRHGSREYQAFGYLERYRPEDEALDGSGDGNGNGTQNGGNGDSGGDSQGNGQGDNQGGAGGGDIPLPGEDTGPAGQTGNNGNAG